MDENFERKSIPPEEGSDKKYSVETIVADLSKFGDMYATVNALSISSILRGTVTDLQNQLTDTSNSGASLLIQSYSIVSKLFKENKLPKDAGWYSQLEKKVVALDILMIGANFDSKFQDKAEKGFEGELEEIDRFLEWLEKKGVSMSQYGLMTDDEVDRYEHEFDTEVSRGLN